MITITTVELLQKSIDYIEENLKTDITITEIAQHAGFSVYHFCRLFSNYIGMPVAAYMTKRRLYHGIYDIQAGKKTIDVALEYGFNTYPGFYKAFKREFGCSPTRYLDLNTVSKPVPIDLSKEAKFMLNKRQITQLLSKWDVEKELEINDVFTAGGAIKSNNAWSIGDKYIFKTGKNISGLKTHIAISRALEKAGMKSPTPIKTKTGEDFIIQDDRYYILTNRIEGQFLSPDERYSHNRESIGEKYGEAIGSLHKILKKQDKSIEVNDNNLLKTVLDWALPKTRVTMEQWACPLPDEFYENYINNFPKIYDNSPRHIIHRDANPSNIIFNEVEVSGFLEFEISERNVRIFDPCYCATGILSEAGEIEAGYEKWPDILRGIIRGYDKAVNLSNWEKEAIPYVIYSIQMIFIAWLLDNESYKGLAIRNREMLLWIWENRDKCFERIFKDQKS
mgnify:CR=1 FL=1